MSVTDIFIIVLCAAASLACVIAFVKFIVEACIGTPSGWRERSRLKSHKRSLTNTTIAFNERNYADAYQRLLSAFHFELIRNDADAIEQINAHHHALLQQALTYAKSQSFGLEDFEVLADLVLSRTVLLRSYFEAENNRRILQKKGSKKVPDWALDEYSRKISDLKEKLATNQKSIVLQFEKALQKGTSRASSDEEVVYH